MGRKGDIWGTYAWKTLSRTLRATLPPVCAWCGEEIDRDLGATHRMSWTLDHIKSQVDYPELALEPSNLVPMHRACNSAKSAGRKRPGNRGSREW
jgi:5-methylcytosine-specific restriction endonuclease McrA